MVIDMHGPGVEVRPLRQITGNADFNEVFFNDVFVPDDDVVGTPNDGWTVARSTLGNERVSIGGGSAGIFPGMDLFDLLHRHGDRVPGAAARVGAVLTKDHALKVLNLRRAQRAVVGGGPGPEGNVTKLVLAELGEATRPAPGRPRRAAIWRFSAATARSPGLRSWPPGPCRSPAGPRRSPATRSPSASSGCPGIPSISRYGGRRVPGRGRLLDDRERDLDVAPGGVGVGAHLVGRLDQ